MVPSCILLASSGSNCNFSQRIWRNAALLGTEANSVLNDLASVFLYMWALTSDKIPSVSRFPSPNMFLSSFRGESCIFLSTEKLLLRYYRINNIFMVRRHVTDNTRCQYKLTVIYYFDEEQCSIAKLNWSTKIKLNFLMGPIPICQIFNLFMAKLDWLACVFFFSLGCLLHAAFSTFHLCRFVFMFCNSSSFFF